MKRISIITLILAIMICFVFSGCISSAPSEGASITFYVTSLYGDDDEETVDSEMMDKVIEVLENRLAAAGYSMARVDQISDSNLVRVDIPNVDDPEEAARYLGSTAHLTFFTAGENQDEIAIVFTGDNVKDAKAILQSNFIGQQEYVVQLKLDDNARKSFADATERSALTGEPIYIMLDGAIISAPVASERIDSTECVITGGFDAASAPELANLISSGNLPCELKLVEIGVLDESFLDSLVAKISDMLS